ncbi:molybdate ABC transporter substrate-binding protein [Ornithinimicrobium kibberense]|uniref:Molybdate ABC transporter substrate-binding protein n=1 Tax=Ornithinimicrobium kibberense TaxID=282060 RepID=A0ABV5V506_9MICO|nr:molybdate ABC transporter substrate-binding protein [Ornithinimicrobium kibberense]
MLPRSAALGLSIAVGLAIAVGLSGCGPATGGTSGGGSGSGAPTSDGLTVLAASSLTDVLEEVADLVRAEHPDLRVDLGFAASSTIVQQVGQGAPADVVVLAGPEPLAMLDPDLVRGDPVVVATNTLALAVPAGPGSDPGAGPVASVEDLARDGIRLVVCRPEAPCGRAAQTLLTDLGLAPRIASYEPDARATLTKVELGEADAGLVWGTDVLAADGAVRAVPLPEGAEVVNDYPLAVVSDDPAAAWFVEAVTSEDGRKVLADAGFGLP